VVVQAGAHHPGVFKGEHVGGGFACIVGFEVLVERRHLFVGALGERAHARRDKDDEGQKGLSQARGTDDIGTKHLVKEFAGTLAQDEAIDEDAGAVDKHVEASESFVELLDCCADGFFGMEVKLYVGGLVIVLLERGGHLGTRRSVAQAHNHMLAMFFGKSSCSGKANASVSTRYEVDGCFGGNMLRAYTNGW
jgi:hypothetical protein